MGTDLRRRPLPGDRHGLRRRDPRGRPEDPRHALRTRAPGSRRAPDQLVYTTEFMHPRLEEICGTLPAGLGRWLENSRPSAASSSAAWASRRMRSGTLGGFLMLYALAGMRRFRRATLRHQIEKAGLEQWLDLVARLAPQDYALAVETVNCRRLVKGYSDTHVRGGGKYRQLLAAAENWPAAPTRPPACAARNGPGQREMRPHGTPAGRPAGGLRLPTNHARGKRRANPETHRPRSPAGIAADPFLPPGARGRRRCPPSVRART